MLLAHKSKHLRSKGTRSLRCLITNSLVADVATQSIIVKTCCLTLSIQREYQESNSRQRATAWSGWVRLAYQDAPDTVQSSETANQAPGASTNGHYLRKTQVMLQDRLYFADEKEPRHLSPMAAPSFFGKSMSRCAGGAGRSQVGPPAAQPSARPLLLPPWPLLPPSWKGPLPVRHPGGAPCLGWPLAEQGDKGEAFPLLPGKKRKVVSVTRGKEGKV